MKQTIASYKKILFETQNDLRAALARCRLADETMQNLRKEHALQSNELIKAYRERDDWRDAFRTVSKLVK